MKVVTPVVIPPLRYRTPDVPGAGKQGTVSVFAATLELDESSRPPGIPAIAAGPTEPAASVGLGYEPVSAPPAGIPLIVAIQLIGLSPLWQGAL
jgi:hypothetical protein